MIEAVSYPEDLSQWKVDQNPFYLEVYGETEPTINRNFAQVLPVSFNDDALQESSQNESLTFVYQYWWTVGYTEDAVPEKSRLAQMLSSGSVTEHALHVYLYFPINSPIGTISYCTIERVWCILCQMYVTRWGKVSYMQPQRTAMTDCLADVIHIIHMGEKSGVLTVERGEGNTLEEGFIRFIGGRVVEAGANQQSGMTAFTYLNGWQVCRFSFIAQIPRVTPLPLQSTQPLPAYRDPASTAPVTSPLYADPLVPVSQNDGFYASRDVPGSRFTAPLRLQAGEEALHHPENTARLPRIQRRLLLLINGQRSIGELAHLMSRSVSETQPLLDDLERSGYIQQ